MLAVACLCQWFGFIPPDVVFFAWLSGIYSAWWFHDKMAKNEAHINRGNS
jgi:hypothetical protein